MWQFRGDRPKDRDLALKWLNKKRKERKKQQ